ncbi:endonuclease/exonuclease/phosphatase family protein [Ovoidimarina sediminis]|uniref:endonuclease/exonuclease/phosphatase family protein n=1 Tax=Ovoidimarina sediminis TaxID=3079856 RepID=UPI00290A0608|nr:endonuclease/exonuclease/phosphatase family protein [Rhodophyticola sp. MJ-SS7]MDU8942617.1 endonuclease/exonuclease/phosphatase family protein [Rhodophyticola sp. MJ-SS7]
MILACLAAAPGAAAETIRIATFNAELAREGPGLLLRDLLKDAAPDITSARDLIALAHADIVVLQGFDYDYGNHALVAFRDRIARDGPRYTHLFSAVPNAGLRSGMDLDGNGQRDGARDAHGYGRFAGQGGMAVLSRWPIALRSDFTALRWADLPEAGLTPEDPGAGTRRLSSVAHWVLTVTPNDRPPITLMTWHATPPVFDGPEDLNGRRNRDETLLWRAYLDGALGADPPQTRFILAGVANSDPSDGEGLKGGIGWLLSDPRLQDPQPESPYGALAADAQKGANLSHGGDPAGDTADWADGEGGPGNLRVDYVIPSADWNVAAAGILWPETPGEGASRHGLVWADLTPR